MAKILHGIVDDGTREIPLVNKYGKTICTVYMRPADFSIVDRYNALMLNFNDVVKPLKLMRFLQSVILFLLSGVSFSVLKF